MKGVLYALKTVSCFKTVPWKVNIWWREVSLKGSVMIRLRPFSKIFVRIWDERRDSSNPNAFLRHEYTRGNKINWVLWLWIIRDFVVDGQMCSTDALSRLGTSGPQTWKFSSGRNLKFRRYESPKIKQRHLRLVQTKGITDRLWDVLEIWNRSELT